MNRLLIHAAVIVAGGGVLYLQYRTPPSKDDAHEQPRAADSSSTQEGHLVISEPLPENNWGHHSSETIGTPTMWNASSAVLTVRLTCLFLLSVCCFLAFSYVQMARTRHCALDIREARLADREAQLNKHRAEQDYREAQLNAREAEQDYRDCQLNVQQAEQDELERKLDIHQAEQDERERELDVREAQLKTFGREARGALAGEQDAFAGEQDALVGEQNVHLSEAELQRIAQEYTKKLSERKRKAKNGDLEEYPTELTEADILGRKCKNYIHKRDRKRRRLE